jgi:hypothetical protein
MSLLTIPTLATSYLKQQFRVKGYDRVPGAIYTGNLVISQIPIDTDELIADGVVTTSVVGIALLPAAARIVPQLSGFYGEDITSTFAFGTAADPDRFSTTIAVGNVFTGGVYITESGYPAEVASTEWVLYATVTTALDAGEVATVQLAWLMP